MPDPITAHAHRPMYDAPPPQFRRRRSRVLLIALPVILLVVGAITFVVKRPAPESESKGVNGGLVLMGIGGFLTLAVLAFLMLAQ